MVKASGKKTADFNMPKRIENYCSEMFFPDAESLLSACLQEIRRWPKYSVVSALIRFIKIECHPLQNQRH